MDCHVALWLELPQHVWYMILWMKCEMWCWSKNNWELEIRHKLYTSGLQGFQMNISVLEQLSMVIFSDFVHSKIYFVSWFLFFSFFNLIWSPLIVKIRPQHIYTDCTPTYVNAINQTIISIMTLQLTMCDNTLFKYHAQRTFAKI